VSAHVKITIDTCRDGDKRTFAEMRNAEATLGVVGHPPKSSAPRSERILQSARLEAASRLRAHGSYRLTSGRGRTLRHSPWIDAQLLHAGN
jgi:hypothetical protein